MALLVCGQGGSNGSVIVTQINANTTAIEAIVARLDTLEALVAAYKSVTNKDIMNIGDTYQTIASLNEVDMAIGKYTVHLSTTYKLDVTSKSVLTQFTLNGGTAENFSVEPKDRTDRVALSYAFPYEHSGGDFGFVLDMAKEDSSGVLDCYFANIWIVRES